jgi:hypothetical protein
MPSTPGLGKADNLSSALRQFASAGQSRHEGRHAMQVLMRELMSEFKAAAASSSAAQGSSSAGTQVTLSSSAVPVGAAPTKAFDPSSVVPFGQDPETQGLFNALKSWDYTTPYAQWPDEQKRDFFEAAMGTMSRTNAGYDEIAQKSRLLGVAEADIPVALARVPALSPAGVGIADSGTATVSSNGNSASVQKDGRKDSIRALVQSYLALASTAGGAASNIASTDSGSRAGPSKPDADILALLQTASSAKQSASGQAGQDPVPDATLANLLQALLQKLGGTSISSSAPATGGTVSTRA